MDFNGAESELKQFAPEFAGIRGGARNRTDSLDCVCKNMVKVLAGSALVISTVPGMVQTHEKARDSLGQGLSSRKQHGQSQHVLEWNRVFLCRLS